MAKLILNDGEKEEEIADDSEIKDVCEEKFGIPFGCKDGICGTCIVVIAEGNENLSEKNEKEYDMLPDNDNERLACQCRVKKGVVKIDY